MSQFHRQLSRRIKRKEAEIQELENEKRSLRSRTARIESEIQAATAAVEAFKEALSLAPEASSGMAGVTELRKGSTTAKAYEALKDAGEPLHINKLLAAIGREPTRSARTSLSGSIAAYVRRGEIFTRTDPNTFGLVEWASGETNEEEERADTAAPQRDDEIPF